jgi:hypothetical protein
MRRWLALSPLVVALLILPAWLQADGPGTVNARCQVTTTAPSGLGNNTYQFLNCDPTSGLRLGAGANVIGHVVVDSGAITATTSPYTTGTVVSGQQAVTASAAALASNTVKQAQVMADPNNLNPVYVGPSGVTTATGYKLMPGGSTPMLPVNNTNVLFIIGSTNDNVSWIATN